MINKELIDAVEELVDRKIKAAFDEYSKPKMTSEEYAKLLTEKTKKVVREGLAATSRGQIQAKIPQKDIVECEPNRI